MATAKTKESSAAVNEHDEGRSFLSSSGSEVETMTSRDMPGWTAESLDIYREYTKRLSSEGWKLILNSADAPFGTKCFTTSHPDPAAHFAWATFFHPQEKRALAIWQFGDQTEGGPRNVHGGAIATALDDTFGNCLETGLKLLSATVNLQVNFLRFIPCKSTVIIDTKVDKIEGRKYYMSGTVRSADGEITYSTGTALFLLVTKEQFVNSHV